jgi:excisionase family DNA binding protein
MTKRLPSTRCSEISGDEFENHLVKADSSSRPRQYTVLEAAEYLELHPSTVYSLVAESLIQHRRKGPKKGRLFFLEEDLQDYLIGSTKKRKGR